MRHAASTGAPVRSRPLALRPVSRPVRDGRLRAARDHPRGDRQGGPGRDLSVVDLNFPSNPRSLTLDEVGAALKENGLSAIGLTPDIYTRQFRRGAFTNPDPE